MFKSMNEWWLSLSRGRQNILIDDKWMLVQAAWDASKTEWIPVNSWEEIPDGIWLVTLDTAETHFSSNMRTCQIDKGKFSTIGDYSTWDAIADVIAYMPLPKPYRK